MDTASDAQAGRRPRRFVLETLVQRVELTSAEHECVLPTVVFRFLDFPLLLCHQVPPVLHAAFRSLAQGYSAKRVQACLNRRWRLGQRSVSIVEAEEDVHALLDDDERVAAALAPPVVVPFSSGKACVMELPQAVLDACHDTAPLYVMLCDALPSDGARLVAAVTLNVAACFRGAALQLGHGSHLNGSFTLLTPAGVAVGTAELAVRVTELPDDVPPAAPQPVLEDVVAADTSSGRGSTDEDEENIVPATPEAIVTARRLLAQRPMPPSLFFHNSGNSDGSAGLEPVPDNLPSAAAGPGRRIGRVRVAPPDSTVLDAFRAHPAGATSPAALPFLPRRQRRRSMSPTNTQQQQPAPERSRRSASPGKRRRSASPTKRSVAGRVASPVRMVAQRPQRSILRDLADELNVLLAQTASASQPRRDLLRRRVSPVRHSPSPMRSRSARPMSPARSTSIRGRSSVRTGSPVTTASRRSTRSTSTLRVRQTRASRLRRRANKSRVQGSQPPRTQLPLLESASGSSAAARAAMRSPPPTPSSPQVVAVPRPAPTPLQIPSSPAPAVAATTTAAPVTATSSTAVRPAASPGAISLSSGIPSATSSLLRSAGPVFGAAEPASASAGGAAGATPTIGDATSVSSVSSASSGMPAVHLPVKTSQLQHAASGISTYSSDSDFVVPQQAKAVSPSPSHETISTTYSQDSDFVSISSTRTSQKAISARSQGSSSASSSVGRARIPAAGRVTSPGSAVASMQPPVGQTPRSRTTSLDSLRSPLSPPSYFPTWAAGASGGSSSSSSRSGGAAAVDASGKPVSVPVSSSMPDMQAIDDLTSVSSLGSFSSSFFRSAASMARPDAGAAASKPK